MKLLSRSLKATKNELAKNKKELKDFNQQALVEIQTILKANNYYHGVVDGLVGPKTYQAFAKFKADRYLAYPTWVGYSTIKALDAIKPSKIKPLTQESSPIYSIAKEVKLNLFAGTKTGRSMTLPGNILVYQNQYIVPGIPLTWGEMTKNCTRVPHSKQIVRNIIHIAEQFSKIRSVYGSALHITSGYRPPHLKIGARYSQHKRGLAIDVFPLDRKLNRLWQIVLKSNVVGVGDGRKKGFIHCDWRTNSKRVIFNY